MKVILNFYSEVHLERNNKSTNISSSTLTFLKYIFADDLSNSKFKKNYSDSNHLRAITGGVLPLGGAIGGCFGGVGADYFGRYFEVKLII